MPVALFLALLLSTLRAKSLLHLALRQPGLKVSQAQEGLRCSGAISPACWRTRAPWLSSSPTLASNIPQHLRVMRQQTGPHFNCPPPPKQAPEVTGQSDPSTICCKGFVSARASRQSGRSSWKKCTVGFRWQIHFCFPCEQMRRSCTYVRCRPAFLHGHAGSSTNRSLESETTFVLVILPKKCPENMNEKQGALAKKQARFLVSGTTLGILRNGSNTSFDTAEFNSALSGRRALSSAILRLCCDQPKESSDS